MSTVSPSQTDRPSRTDRRTRTALLPLGHVVATPGALDAAREHGVNVVALLHRHRRGDWGDLSAHDARANDRAADDGDGRVLSSYETRAGRIWVITEADRSSTTVLLPSEY
ncbi:hypothetical protein RQM47_16340 [Rubrivirga sp. S365]|uniref:hypothetical protein n=1 Tax=Rubrivirga sp. S365 TaxID=3076080 RepID=UPI0028C9876D|nr:hypothetical protein [Rubrivirga sp. S365]MDT7858219.1 hypothetical protein [Rubrivirga sp. S365]